MIGFPLNAEIVPSSLANINLAGLGLPVPPLLTTNPVPPLKTRPVGFPCAPPAPGTVKNEVAAVLMLKSVALPLPLSAIHQGVGSCIQSPRVNQVGILVVCYPGLVGYDVVLGVKL